jgi:hypothetical protein
MKLFKRVATMMILLVSLTVMVADYSTLTCISTGGVSLAMAVTLPTQKIVFLTSLKEEYEQIDTWLNEAEDLSSFVEDGQTLVFPEAGKEPAVYKNRTTDIDHVEPTETVHKTELEVYDTQNYKIRNIYLHAIPFDKIQHYTKKSADAIVKKEIADAAYAFAPQQAGNKRIVEKTTGSLRNGLKTLTLDDIVRLARKLDNAEFPDGRNLVLTSDMWWDLINNNDILKGQLERMPMDGRIKPKFVEYHDIKIHKSLGDKLGIAWDLDTDSKAAQGTALDTEEGIVPAALLFCDKQVFRAGGNMEMFYLEKSQNPSGRAYEFGFQHRFKSDFQMDTQRYSGVLVLDVAA